MVMGDSSRTKGLCWVGLALVFALAAGATYSYRQCPWLTVVVALLCLTCLILAVRMLFPSVVQRARPLTQEPLNLLLACALVVGILSLMYQAGVPFQTVTYPAWEESKLSGGNRQLTLAIAYPPCVPLEAAGKPGLPLSVYLWPPVLPATPTPSLGSPAPTSTASAPTGSITDTLLASIAAYLMRTSTPTATNLVTYTVGFLPYHDAVVFTDEKGVPVAPEVSVTAGGPPREAQVLYLRRGSTHHVSRSLPVTVQVYGPTGTPVTVGRLELALEDAYGAWFRHFWGLVLGPTTQLLALAATLVTFAWQLWQEKYKRRQACLDAVRRVEVLLGQGRLKEAREKLAELKIRCARDPVLKEDLEAAHRSVLRTWAYHVRDVVILADFVDAAKQYQQLQDEIATALWKDAELTAAMADVEAHMRPDRLKWPSPWREERPPDPPAIAHWLAEGDCDLRFNPFGPTRAEADPFLPELYVPPPGWSLIEAPEPTFVFGEKGSGLTASLLLLAHRCSEAALGPRSASGGLDTFPVRVALTFEGQGQASANVCWWTLTHGVAQAAMQFLALNPQALRCTPHRQRRALARLITMHRASLGDLGGYVQEAGQNPAVAGRMAAEIRRLAMGIRVPGPEASKSALETVADARPAYPVAKLLRAAEPQLWSWTAHPFEQCYLLLDVPSEASGRWTADEMAAGIRPWLEIVRPLADRRIYVKLFMPSSVRCALEGPLLGIADVELTWDAPGLRAMLESRLAAAGEPGFEAFVQGVPDGLQAGDLVAQAAMESPGPPRRLIELGQELLVEHISRAEQAGKRPGPRLHWDELSAVLDRSSAGGGP